MKKKLFALSGIFLIAIVITGLWATKAISFTEGSQEIQSESAATSLGAGLSLQEMTIQSSLIVRGTCVGTRSQWIDRRLFTVATVSVKDTFKGESLDQVEVAVPGGISNKGKFQLAMTYVDAPQMYDGDDVVLFLVPGEIGNTFAVAGFSQGKYSVVKDDTNKEYIGRDQNRVRIPQGVGVTRGIAQLTPLDEFIEQVSSYLQ